MIEAIINNKNKGIILKLVYKGPRVFKKIKKNISFNIRYMIKTKKIMQNGLENDNFFESSKYVLNIRTLLTILTKINITAGKSTKKNTRPAWLPERLFKTPIVTKKRNRITKISEEANNNFEFWLSHPFLNKIADISKPILVNIESDNAITVMMWLA